MRIWAQTWGFCMIREARTLEAWAAYTPKITNRGGSRNLYRPIRRSASRPPTADRLLGLFARHSRRTHPRTAKDPLLSPIANYVYRACLPTPLNRLSRRPPPA